MLSKIIAIALYLVAAFDVSAPALAQEGQGIVMVGSLTYNSDTLVEEFKDCDSKNVFHILRAHTQVLDVLRMAEHESLAYHPNGEDDTRITIVYLMVHAERKDGPECSITDYYSGCLTDVEFDELRDTCP